MLLGSVTADAASAAEAGPFWRHRTGGSGEGAKIEPKAPENFSGKAGVETLGGEISNAKVVLTSAAAQVKGAIFNAEHQGQIKIAIFYQQPEVKVNGETPKECTASIGQQGQFSDIVQLKGHLAWKWNGTRSQLIEEPQLNQKWDIIFTQTEPQQQASNDPLLDLRKAAGVFAEISLVGPGCGVLAGKQKVAGAEVGLPSLSQLEEWSKKLSIRTIPSGTLPATVETFNEKPAVGGVGFLQHIWVSPIAQDYQPLVLGLTFGNNAASLVGQTETEAAQQEIAVFEK